MCLKPNASKLRVLLEHIAVVAEISYLDLIECHVQDGTLLWRQILILLSVTLLQGKKEWRETKSRFGRKAWVKAIKQNWNTTANTQETIAPILSIEVCGSKMEGWVRESRVCDNAPYFWPREGALKSIFITSRGNRESSCTVLISVLLSLLLHCSFKLL